jgi:hypothetical protein
MTTTDGPSMLRRRKPVRLRYAESLEARNAAMTVICPNLLLYDGTIER